MSSEAPGAKGDEVAGSEDLEVALNRLIEIHDSTLGAVVAHGTDVEVHFSPAYVHASEGKPGVHRGTGWTQHAVLHIRNGRIEQCVASGPQDPPVQHFYHMAADTADKVSVDALQDTAAFAARALLRIANDTNWPNMQRSKAEVARWKRETGGRHSGSVPPGSARRSTI